MSASLIGAWRTELAAVLAAAAVLLAARAFIVGGPALPRAGAIARWLRGFRLLAIALGCAAIAAGLLSGHTWLIGVGLAFALEETMETSVCLSALAAGSPSRATTAAPGSVTRLSP